MVIDDRSLIQYRVRAVRLGVHTTIVVLAGLLLYLVSPSGRGLPIVPVAFLWLVTAGGALVAALLPWERLLARPRGIWLLYAWSAVDIILISLFIAIADPTSPTSFLLYAFTTVFFAASYPIHGQVWLFTLTVASYLAVVRLASADLSTERFLFHVVSLGVIAFLASFMSRELLQRTAAYESLVRAQSDLGEGLSVVDLKTQRFVYVNDALCRIFGYSREEMLALDSFLDLTLDEDRRVFEGRIDVRLKGIVTQDHDELTVRRGDGRLVRVEVAYKPIDASRVLSITRDITARKTAEDEMRASLSLLEATLESTADGILVVDKRGRIVVYNERFAEMWRIPVDVLEGRDDSEAIAVVLEQLVHPESFLSKIRDLYASDVESFDVVQFRDGRVFERWSQPQRLGGREGAIVGRVWSFRDVTERVTSERELLKMNTALRQADRERHQLLVHLVKAKEDERKRVAADIHDDSVQVMTSVALGLERLARNARDADDRSFIERLERSARDAVRRLRTMVFELRPPALDEDGLTAALRLYLEEFRMDTNIDAALTTSIDEEPVVTLRPVLYRIAQEALTNVRKHAQASHVDLCLERSEGGVRLRIEDDGVGFAPRERVDRVTRHVGLVEMRERAEIAGGRFEVRSQPGRGTVVEVWVPETREVAAS